MWASFYFNSMKNIIDLNAELEKLAKPEIYFHQDYQTFSLFGTWVVEADYKYFEDWQKRIIDKINNIADLDRPSKVKFIKVFHQDVLKKYSDINELNTESLEQLKSTFSGQYTTPDSVDKPKKKCSEFSYEIESWNEYDFLEYHNIVYKLGVIFYCDDLELMADGEYSLTDEKYNIDELVLEKIQENELKLPVFESNEERIEMLYSYVHLSFCLDNIKTLLKNIAKHLDYLVNLIKKVENFEEDKLTLDEVYDNDPNNLKLEYKINKMDVALFYRVLHDIGIIHVDNKNQKHPYTNLKKYINNANMYYLENKKVDKVKNINKEFAKFLNDNKYEKHEIKLVELLIEKLKSRKEYIEANHEEGLR